MFSGRTQSSATMPRTPNRADQYPAAPVDADEATIAQAWQQQLGQASTNPTLAARLRHASPALYGRFADAYRRLLALSRARRRKLLRGMGMTLAGAALAFALALGHVPAAQAAGISVGGGCTLIDAITAANTNTATGGCAAGSGADTITLPANSTITLTRVNNSTYGPSGLPVITSAITIRGNGATIARDASAANFIIMPVASSGNLILDDTTITGGSGSAGGGILNHGIATLNSSTVSGNTVSGNTASKGGGIYNVSGTLTLNNSTVSGNTASYVGGGIYNVSGTATLNNSTVSGNTASYGGGILNFDGRLTLSNSTVSRNNAAANHSGGGILNFNGTLTLSNSIVSGNTARYGGGILNEHAYGTATLSNSTVSGNTAGFSGGGILNADGTLTLSNSTVSGNTASYGGGILNEHEYSTATLSNSTVSGNTASHSGGGIFNSLGTLTLSNSTVSGNTTSGNGGGIFNNTLYYDYYDYAVYVIGSARLERSLISGNRAAGQGNELYNYNELFDGYTYTSILHSANYNLFGHSGENKSQAVANFTPSGSDITATRDGTRPAALAAILDTTLQNNGGATKTHALVPGSPAVDAVPSGPATDQRGIHRPQGAHFDIGAFELTSTDLTNRCTINGGVLICEMLPAIWSR